MKIYATHLTMMPKLFSLGKTSPFQLVTTRHALCCHSSLLKFEADIRIAAINNFDMPRILRLILDQMDLTQAYQSKNIESTHPLVMEQARQLLSKVTDKILGLQIDSTDSNEQRLIDEVVSFRSRIRTLALSRLSDPNLILSECDALRDSLGNLGISIKDGITKANQKWKFK